MMEQPGMSGIAKQVLRVHDGNSVAVYIRNGNYIDMPMAVDRRDCAIHVSIPPLEMPHTFTCTHLVHYTENEFAEKIGFGNEDTFNFRASPWKITPNESFELTWWSPLPPNNWKEVIDESLPNIWNVFNDMGNSSPFNGKTICGPFGFVISWSDILDQYAVNRGKNRHDVELRILGTFLYTKEIMYAILVCVKGDAGVESYPLINADGTETFLPMSSDFIWKVYSTVGYSKKRPFGVVWTWDHLAFGFNCPTSPFQIDPKFCTITTKECEDSKPMSRPSGQNRTELEMQPSELLIERINRKILDRQNL